MGPTDDACEGGVVFLECGAHQPELVATVGGQLWKDIGVDWIWHMTERHPHHTTTLFGVYTLHQVKRACFS